MNKSLNYKVLWNKYLQFEFLFNFYAAASKVDFTKNDIHSL